MDLPEKFRARLNAPPDISLEAARKFIHFYYADAISTDEVREHLVRTAARNPRGVRDGLLNIEALLSYPQEKGILSNLVAVYANKILEDPNDEGAKAWLHEAAQLIRNVLGEKQPPKPDLPPSSEFPRA